MTKWDYESVKKGGIFSRGHRPCKGASPTPWLWTGGTKEVRTSGDRDDPGRHGRCAAIEGRVYTRP